MSESQDKSDDLIAELAKLMANNAQGSENDVTPAVVKLAPLSEPSPAPIRIPGAAEPAPAASPVRIPGMDKAAAESAAPPSVAAPTSRPATSFDFGKPPSAAPLRAPEPLTNWQNRPPAKPEPTTQPPSNAGSSGVTATVAAVQQPATPAEVRQATPAGDFDFDFGLGGSATDSQGRGEESQNADTDAAPAAEHDPIADLIAAEVGAVISAPVQPAAGAAPTGLPLPPSGHSLAPAPQAPVAPAVHRQQQPDGVEGDKFAVAPVFGLGGKASPAAAMVPPPTPVRPPVAQATPQPVSPSGPRPDADPMDEIENLIGEAVRTEMSGGGKQPDPSESRPQPPAPAAPVVPPLSTGFAPRRAGLKDQEPQMRSAEAAILAAAAATGAAVDIVEAAPPAAEPRPKQAKGSTRQRPNMFGGARQYVGMAVAGTLLLAAGFGLYWVLGMGGGDTAAPVLTADATPAKQAPAPVAAAAEEPTRSVVFDEINGVAAASDAETLVSRDETAGTDATEVARVVTPQVVGTTESGLANRKVRTVTVRPDGTIVSGDEAVAGTEALPVERPNVPAVPGAATEPSELLAVAAARADAPAAAAVAAESAVAAVNPEADTLPDPIDAALANAGLAEAGEETPAVFDASLVAPRPMPRPGDRSALVASTPSRTTNLAALPLVDLNEPLDAPPSASGAASAAPAPTATASTGGSAAAYVQLFSQRSEGEAQASLQNAQRRYGSLLGGRQLEIQRADLGAKGIYYRVLAPAATRTEAVEVCTAIKANGGDCFVQ